MEIIQWYLQQYALLFGGAMDGNACNDLIRSAWKLPVVRRININGGSDDDPIQTKSFHDRIRNVVKRFNIWLKWDWLEEKRQQYIVYFIWVNAECRPCYPVFSTFAISPKNTEKKQNKITLHVVAQTRCMCICMTYARVCVYIWHSILAYVMLPEFSYIFSAIFHSYVYKHTMFQQISWYNTFVYAAFMSTHAECTYILCSSFNVLHEAWIHFLQI